MKITTLSILLALALLSGCGIKPGDVSAPKGVAKDEFPRTYPDPATDPRSRN
jgi:hypothetical protein